LIPYLDSCNCRLNKSIKSEITFDVKPSKDYKNLEVLISEPFKKGEEVNYSYSSNYYTNIYIGSYGMYFKNVNNKSHIVSILLKKQFFSLVKHDLCLKLNCFENQNYNIKYEDKSIDQYVVNINLHSKNNSHILNIFRLSYVDQNMLEQKLDLTYDYLKNGRYLSFEHELLALSTFYTLINAPYEHKPNFNDLIHINQVSKNNYRKNNKYADNDKLAYKYKLRKTHFYQVYEEKQVSLSALNENAKNSIKLLFANIIDISGLNK